MLASVLASSKSPLATLGSLQQAETALAGTTESVNALQRCGVLSNDTILSQLLAHQQQQLKKVQQLTRGALSVATQKEAHAVAKQPIREKLALLEDAANKGCKAAQRGPRTVPPCFGRLLRCARSSRA